MNTSVSSQGPCGGTHSTHRSGPSGRSEAEFFAEFASGGVDRRFVGLGHAAWEVPVGLVVRVDQEEAAVLVAQDDVGRDALAGLASVALREVGIPGLGVALVELLVVCGHASSRRSSPLPR